MTITDAKTDEALAEFRERAIANQEIDKDAVFTCDDCGARWTCPLVFDWYNQFGDCLAEK